MRDGLVSVRYFIQHVIVQCSPVSLRLINVEYINVKREKQIEVKSLVFQRV